MDRAGKYTIGSTGIGRNGKFDGIYAFDRQYGLAYSASIKKLKEHGDRIYVIDNAEDAQKYVQYLSRLYRYEFRNSAKKYGVAPSEFRFYAIRLTDRRFDDLEFEGEIRPSDEKRERAWSKKYQFIGDYKNVGTILIKKVSE